MIAAEVQVEETTGLESRAMIDVRAIMRTLRCSDRTIQRLVAERKFPPPVMLRGARRWFLHQVQEFLEARAEEARAAQREAAGA